MQIEVFFIVHFIGANSYKANALFSEDLRLFFYFFYFYLFIFVASSSCHVHNSQYCSIQAPLLQSLLSTKISFSCCVAEIETLTMATYM